MHLPIFHPRVHDWHQARQAAGFAALSAGEPSRHSWSPSGLICVHHPASMPAAGLRHFHRQCTASQGTSLHRCEGQQHTCHATLSEFADGDKQGSGSSHRSRANRKRKVSSGATATFWWSWSAVSCCKASHLGTVYTMLWFELGCTLLPSCLAEGVSPENLEPSGPRIHDLAGDVHLSA